MVKLALAALALAACGDGAVVVAPVIDGPTNELASGFPVNTLTLTVTHAGDDPRETSITSATFQKGQPLELAGLPFADDLVIHMTGQVGNAESYGRTCPFSVSADGAPAQPHLYFASSGSLGYLPFTPEPREGGEAISYHDGTGMLVGGHAPGDPASPLADIERYDPRDGSFDVLAHVSARMGGAATLYGLDDGARLAVVGGTVPDGAGGQTAAPDVALVEADSPADRRVTQITNATALGRVGITATTLADGSILVAGGPPGTDPSSGAVTDLFVVNNASGVDQVSPAIGHLAVARSFHTATLLGDQTDAPVLIAGGVDASGAPVAQAELYKPALGDIEMGFNPAMSVARSHHRAVRLPDNSVLIVGGIKGDGTPVDTLERFTLDGGFQVVTGSDGKPVQLPSAAGHVDMSVTLLPATVGGDVRILLTGGTVGLGDGQPLDTVYQINIPAEGPILPVTELPVKLAAPRAGHQATLLCNGMVMISGGTSSPEPIEIYDPGSLGQR